ncbi:MAG: tetratricopeptide repeat protein [Anaerolineales bacterium]|nr:tetratricopeptide repeat protein [Anaerolineales bacterium]
MKFDVFLSHNGKDKPAVEILAHKLEAKGFTVWLDKWNLIPGEPWQEGLEEALDDCQTYTVFVGPSGIGPWENEEMRVAIEERVKDKKRRVIPVLLPGAPDNTSLKLPRFLTRLTWVDFRSGINDEDTLYRLECGIKGVAPKPLTKSESTTFTSDTPSVGDLPLGSYLPFSPNPLFTGRVEDLRKLADALVNHASPGTVITQAITGMGGLGKTQLAVEFAYRYGNQFQGVHWLNLADPTTLDSEIASCGQKMGLDYWPDDQPSQVAMTEFTWKAQGPRLLILDNFEDVTNANNVLPRFRHSSIHILVTSRRSDWLPTTGLNPILLELFSPAESLDFLKRSLPKRKDNDTELNTLSERLGHLPLALELASRYLNGHNRLSVTDYLTQTKEALEHASMNAWKKDVLGLTPTQHDTSLLSTFALSWLALKDEIAQKMFQSAGYLAPNTAIPLEIFEKALEISSEQCDEALTLLYGLGLLRESESQPTIHPLLAEYARGLSQESIKILEALADTLATLSKEATDTGLPARFDSIKPHIPVLALFAENKKIEDAGTLWNNYGSHLKMIADYPGARVAYKRALKIDPDKATYIGNLGEVMREQGDLDGARVTHERALKIDEGSFGLNHPHVAIRINNLAAVFYELGNLNDARAAFERALKIDETSFGLDHPNVARDVNNLGEVMRMQEDLNGARAAYERALKIDEATFGPNHPKVGIDINNLGVVMKDQGDLAGARAAFERALKIDEANFGSEHPNVARDVNNLGSVMRAQGDLVGARAAYERALKIDEASFGSDHPNVARDVNNLGMVMKDQGDLVGARAAYERALAIFKKFLPPDHPNIKTVQDNLDSLDE